MGHLSVGVNPTLALNSGKCTWRFFVSLRGSPFLQTVASLSHCLISAMHFSPALLGLLRRCHVRCRERFHLDLHTMALISASQATRLFANSRSMNPDSRSCTAFKKCRVPSPFAPMEAKVSKPDSRTRCEEPSPVKRAGPRIISRIIFSSLRNPEIRVRWSNSLPIFMVVASCRLRSGRRAIRRQAVT